MTVRFLTLLYASATVVFLAYGVLHPERLPIALFFFALGLAGVWRSSLGWKERAR